jgi:hypothetical protein
METWKTASTQGASICNIGQIFSRKLVIQEGFAYCC